MYPKETYNNQVAKSGEEFIPLFKENEINRDHFMILRRQLIELGCPKDNVISIARSLCMKKLNISDEDEYNQYILDDTYYRCIEKITNGYDTNPIMDLNDNRYSHTNLFSSIYGFEIEYLKKKGLYRNITDIGCGDGLLLKIMQHFNIHADGHEIEKKKISHNVKINIIEGINNISYPYSCIILNHVLEHVNIEPHFFLSNLMNHFENHVENNKLKTIIVSLPIHNCIEAHLASNHFWICSDEKPDSFILEKIFSNGMNFYHPKENFAKIAKEFNFELTAVMQYGLYVFEKKEIGN